MRAVKKGDRNWVSIGDEYFKMYHPLEEVLLAISTAMLEQA